MPSTRVVTLGYTFSYTFFIRICRQVDTIYEVYPKKKEKIYQKEDTIYEETIVREREIKMGN